MEEKRIGREEDKKRRGWEDRKIVRKEEWKIRGLEEKRIREKTRRREEDWKRRE